MTTSRMARGKGKGPEGLSSAAIPDRGSSRRVPPPTPMPPVVAPVAPPSRSRPPSPSATPVLAPQAVKMPVGHRPAHWVRRALPKWRKLGASSWVLDSIANGVKIPWTSRPPPRRARPYPASSAATFFIRDEIQRQLDL